MIAYISPTMYLIITFNSYMSSTLTTSLSRTIELTFISSRCQVMINTVNLDSQKEELESGEEEHDVAVGDVPGVKDFIVLASNDEESVTDGASNLTDGATNVTDFENDNDADREEVTDENSETPDGSMLQSEAIICTNEICKH